MLQIDERSITQDTTRNLAPPADLDCNRPIVLDLRPVGFVEPFGLVYLYWLVRSLVDRGGAPVTIRPPRSRDVRNYLVRMHFPQAFSEVERVVFDPDLSRVVVRETDLRERLLEVTTFTLLDDDQVRQLTGDVMETILTRGEDLPVETRYLRLGLIELLSNIEVHSQTRSGILTVQRYGSSEVHIALGDGGIGIPEALRDVVGPLPDDEMVLQALDPHVSSRPGRGGLGLPTIVEEIKKTRGFMGIRSGRAHVKVSRNGAVSRCDCIPLPGTQVEIVWI
ncbi:MAG: hypothetical protein ACREMD_15465 [Gemmatimonadota bacterium]